MVHFLLRVCSEADKKNAILRAVELYTPYNFVIHWGLIEVCNAEATADGTAEYLALRPARNIGGVNASFLT
jgi:hypothetical protein